MHARLDLTQTASKSTHDIDRHLILIFDIHEYSDAQAINIIESQLQLVGDLYQQVFAWRSNNRLRTKHTFSIK